MIRNDAHIAPCELRVATILALIELPSEKKMSIKMVWQSTNRWQ